MATSKKKPSAAQLAARKLFAQRAKAGTLKKSVKRKPAAKRVKNPAPKLKGENNRHLPRTSKLSAPHKSYPYEIYFNGHRIAFASSETNAKMIAQMLADAYGKTVEIRIP